MDLIRRLEQELNETSQHAEQIKADLTRLKGQENDPSLCPVKMSELIEEDLSAFDWLIPQLVIAQGVGIIAGDGGTGKSFLAQHMGLCIASGKKFMEFGITRPRKVLYLAAEGARLPLRDRLMRACRTLLIDPKNVPFYVQHGALSKFHFDSDEFRRLIFATSPDVVFCDTLGYFFGGDENDSSEWKRRVMEPINEIRRDIGTAFIIVHHKNKTGESGRRGGRGTSAMYDDVDHWFDLNLTKELHQNPELLSDPTRGRDRIFLVSKNKYSENQFTAFRVRADFRNAIFEQVPYELPDTKETGKSEDADEQGVIELEDTFGG